MPPQEEVTDGQDNEVQVDDEDDEDGDESFELPPGTLATHQTLLPHFFFKIQIYAVVRGNLSQPFNEPTKPIDNNHL